MQIHRSQMGFTLIEVLMALAISALLLTSLAIAFNASAVSYRENQATVEAVNSARQALVRMTTQLRTGSGVVTSESKCTLTAGTEEINYEYDSINKKLEFYRTASQTDKKLLCQNVASMSFTGDNKSIQISMTVESGNVRYPLSAAVVMRRNLEY